MNRRTFLRATGAAGATKMQVQYDIDWPRFIDMFVTRVRGPLRKAPGG